MLAIKVYPDIAVVVILDLKPRTMVCNYLVSADVLAAGMLQLLEADSRRPVQLADNPRVFQVVAPDRNFIVRFFPDACPYRPIQEDNILFFS